MQWSVGKGMCIALPKRWFVSCRGASQLFFVIWLFLCYSQSSVGAISPAEIKPAAIDPARVRERFVPSLDEDLEDLSSSSLKEKFTMVPKAPIIHSNETQEQGVKFKLVDVVIVGSTVYRGGELTQYYKPYLGKEVYFQDLQKIAAAITVQYRKDGYVISQAIVPAQQVKDGVVKILVVEGYISGIYLEGDVSKVRSQINKFGKKIQQMRPLQIDQLERYLLLLNDISGLTVKTVLSPAMSDMGAADLTFVAEQKRVSTNLAYDNRGSRYMGPSEIIGGLIVNDVAMSADKMSMQTIVTPLHSELRYFHVGYNFPCWNDGLRVNVTGSFTETNPGFSIKILDLVGRSKNWTIEFEYPWLRTKTKNFWLYGKLDWLDSYTNFDSYTVFFDQIRSLRLGAFYDFIDRWKGANSIDLEISKGLTRSPLEPYPDLSRYHGRTDYTKIGMKMSHYHPLLNNMIFLVAITGQYSFNNKLLSAEEFSFGGSQFGRAYDSSEISGDSGVAGKVELRFDTYPNLKFLQQIQYYTFYDLGAVWNVGEEAHIQGAKNSGSNLGFGLRTTVKECIYGSIEIVRPLTKKVDTQVMAGQSGKAWRFFINLGFNM